jgi:hypothetical protein
MLYNFRVLTIACLCCFITSHANAAELWPFQVSESYEYSRTDVNNHTWSVTLDVLAEVTLANQSYFQVRRWNYDDDGDTAEFYWRSTEDAVLVWAGGTTEIVLFLDASPGTTWQSGDTFNEIMPSANIHVPYFGQDINGDDIFLQAIVVRRNNPFDDSPYWYDYLVPGIGFVQEIDWWTDDAPKIQELTNKTAAVPVPAAIWLLAPGIVSIFGFKKKFKG